ncbi:MAG TPA: DNA repair protein RecN [Gemmatimonadales bacterium]|nr:DNA repair protein RecN [Gemmatimonadales bacterium]
MLAELRVRDLAVIADVTLRLGPGFNVLSGETGAGKSMLVDALALLLGERASADVVRPGAEKTVVEGAFDLPPRAPARAVAEGLGVDLADDTLVIRREVYPEGRSRAWVNGSPTTIGVLAQLGAALVDLHGQHETQSLVRGEAQAEILDAYAGAEVERAAVRDAHARWQGAVVKDAELRSRQDEVRRKADYLRHVVEEITQAAPKTGEDQALETEARRLANAEELTRLARELETACDQSALAKGAKTLAALERIDASVAKWREMLDAAFANLQELAARASDYAAGIDADPGRLATIDRRRDTLYRLTQKYGPEIPDVLATRDASARELDLLDTAELDLRSLAEEKEQASKDFVRACEALSAKRSAAAKRLKKAVNDHLPSLGLAGGQFDPGLRRLPAPGALGAEAVSFEVELSPGMGSRPLSRVASGGEQSRLMLALKVVLAGHDRVPTLVFDEVDQGIGGEVGGKVGEALARVAADGRQVLVITHLPQIAVQARHQVVITKGARGGVATSDVRLVEGEDRVREVARMLGDPDLEAAVRHARALLRTASETPGTPAGTSSPPAPKSPRPTR